MISQLTISISFAENKERERICNPAIKIFHFLHQHGKRPLCWPPRRSLQRKRREGERSSQQDRCLATIPMGVEDLQLSPCKLPATYPSGSLCTPQGHVHHSLNTAAPTGPSSQRKTIQVSPGQAGPWGFLEPKVSPSGTCCHTHNQLGTGGTQVPDGVWGLHLGQLSPRPSLQQSVPCPEEGRNCKQERRRAVWRE